MWMLQRKRFFLPVLEPLLPWAPLTSLRGGSWERPNARTRIKTIAVRLHDSFVCLTLVIIDLLRKPD